MNKKVLLLSVRPQSVSTRASANYTPKPRLGIARKKNANASRVQSYHHYTAEMRPLRASSDVEATIQKLAVVQIITRCALNLSRRSDHLPMRWKLLCLPSR